MIKYNIYIGLKEKDMQTTIKKEDAIKIINQELQKTGVKGYQLIASSGYWERQREPSLYLNFVNTFDIKKEELEHCLKNIKERLNQESILYETIQLKEFEFI